MLPRAPRSTLFPYTTLFRSLRVNARGGIELARREQDVDESILLILTTPVGQRRMRPTFGCAVHDLDRKSTRLNSSHLVISYAVFCLKKKKTNTGTASGREPS